MGLFSFSILVSHFSPTKFTCVTFVLKEAIVSLLGVIQKIHDTFLGDSLPHMTFGTYLSTQGYDVTFPGFQKQASSRLLQGFLC